MTTDSKVVELTGDEITIKERTPLQVVLMRFRKHKLAMVSLFLMLGIFLVTLFAAQLANFGVQEIKVGNYLLDPGAVDEKTGRVHLLGTDHIGRDYFSRLIYAGRISLTVAFISVIISELTGMTIGAISGYYGGAVDNVLMRFVEFMLTVPSNQEFSLEWRPPTNEGWQMNVFFAWVLSFAPLAAFSSRKISLMEWVWFLGFGWLAFSGIRYVIWLLFILVLLTARLLAGILPDKQDLPERTRFPAFNAALASLFILLSIVYLPGIREKWWAQAPAVYASDITPIEAVEWLDQHPELPGPLWNDYAFGSYLAYALPSRPVWVDSRFFPFTGGQMDEYLQMSRGSLIWESMFEREGINLLILSTANQPLLIELVGSSSRWCEQYRDEVAVIFSRCEPIR